MEASDHDNDLPRWMSVTGEALELGFDSGFKGKPAALQNNGALS